ncbi:MAG: FecR domain-containing protein [Gammaproteobacteria bacterium]
MESSRDIEECAGTWLAKRESGSWTGEDEARFTQWLSASTANRVAFLRQEAAWEHALRLQALRGHTAPGAVPSPDDWRLSPFVSDGSIAPRPPDPEGGSSPDAARRKSARSRKAYFAFAASAVLATAVCIAWYLWPVHPSYTTPIGGMALVPTQDGSRITLNTDSKIHLSFTGKERRVSLEHGEAFFEVAKDPSRPFVVGVGHKRVIAVGTKFSVRRERGNIRVVVTEGRVRIEDRFAPSVAATTTRPRQEQDAPAPRERDEDRTEELVVAAGGVARAGDAGIIVQQHPLGEVEDYLSWRSGYLVFRDIPLADAIAEFNRYNEQQIFIRDPAVAAIRFSGKIRPTSFDAFIRLLEDAFPIRVQHADGRIVLTDAHGAASAAQQ